VSLFRREPVHKRLAREGGLDLEGRPPHDTTPRWGEPGIHGVARPRQWDAVATRDVPGLEGELAEFVELPDGTLLVEEGDAHGEGLIAVADALELEPPFRARAVRQQGETWAVGARRIAVVTLPPATIGEEIVVSSSEGEQATVVDGMPTFGRVPELERLGASRGESYVVRARRLDGQVWEVQTAAL
jgi:hypothetical protein